MDPFAQFAPPRFPPEAVCAQVDPEAWFPEQGGNPRPVKALCATCPIVAACLTHALTHDELGVWGATSVVERAVLTGRRSSSRQTNRARIVARLESIGVDVEQILRDGEVEAA